MFKSPFWHDSNLVALEQSVQIDSPVQSGGRRQIACVFDGVRHLNRLRRRLCATMLCVRAWAMVPGVLRVIFHLFPTYFTSHTRERSTVSTDSKIICR